MHLGWHKTRNLKEGGMVARQPSFYYNARLPLKSCMNLRRRRIILSVLADGDPMLGTDHDLDEFRRLMQRVDDGSEGAAGELVQRFDDSLRRAIRRTLKPRLRSMFDSADFAQQVWLYFFRHKELALRLGHPQDLFALLLRMAKTSVAHAIRDRLTRRKHDLNRECSLDLLLENGCEIPDGRESAAESLIQREELERLLSRKAERHRRIVELRLQGLSNAEIAKSLSIAESTVSRLCKRLLDNVGWVRRARG